MTLAIKRCSAHDKFFSASGIWPIHRPFAKAYVGTSPLESVARHLLHMCLQDLSNTGPGIERIGSSKVMRSCLVASGFINGVRSTVTSSRGVQSVAKTNIPHTAHPFSCQQSMATLLHQSVIIVVCRDLEGGGGGNDVFFLLLVVFFFVRWRLLRSLEGKDEFGLNIDVIVGQPLQICSVSERWVFARSP